MQHFLTVDAHVELALVLVVIGAGFGLRQLHGVVVADKGVVRQLPHMAEQDSRRDEEGERRSEEEPIAIVIITRLQADERKDGVGREVNHENPHVRFTAIEVAEDDGGEQDEHLEERAKDAQTMRLVAL